MHNLLISEAPAWLIQEVEKRFRGFFWAASERASGGQCLVAWEQLCKPLEYGGLGIKDLKLQSLALRVRWQWLQRTDMSRPWQGLPQIKDEAARALFDNLIQIEAGEGDRVIFWRDRWINGRSAADFAPGLCLTISARICNSRTVDQAMVDYRWFSDIPGTLATRGARELITLWAAVHGVQRHADRRDCFKWPWTASGQYSAKSTYNMIHQGGIRSELHKAIWKSKATPKSKLFMWLASMHRIWTSDRRLRFGLQATQDACSLCLQELETAEHLLVQCSFSREV
jgi:hypothetical protein